MEPSFKSASFTQPVAGLHSQTREIQVVRLTVLSAASLAFIAGATFNGAAIAQPPPDAAKPQTATPAPAAPAQSPAPAQAQSPAGASAAAPDPNLTVASVKMQDATRISKLIGSPVYNDQNEKIGSVDDLLTKDGNTIVMAVVSVGGFLGIGNKLVAVPYDQLHLQTDKDTTKIALPGASKDALNAMPTFTYSG